MLKPKLAHFPLALVLFTLIQAGGCFAETIDLGFIQFVGDPGTTAEFNVMNETGLDSSPLPDTSFPVTTPVPLLDLTLYVNFANGTANSFGPASNYFSAAGVGIELSDPATNPIQSAILIGTFGATALTLSDGADVTIDPDFSAFILYPDFSPFTSNSGNLQNTDFALITGSTVATPEPRMGVMLAAGLGAMILGRRRRLGKVASMQMSVRYIGLPLRLASYYSGRRR